MGITGNSAAVAAAGKYDWYKLPHDAFGGIGAEMPWDNTGIYVHVFFGAQGECVAQAPNVLEKLYHRGYIQLFPTT